MHGPSLGLLLILLAVGLKLQGAGKNVRVPAIRVSLPFKGCELKPRPLGCPRNVKAKASNVGGVILIFVLV